MMSIENGEKKQAKSIENIFNKTTAEKFPSVKKK
jgi:hypothetical protein